MAFLVAYGNQLFATGFADGFQFGDVFDIFTDLGNLITFGGPGSPLPFAIQALLVIGIGLPWLFYFLSLAEGFIPFTAVTGMVIIAALVAAPLPHASAGHGSYVTFQPQDASHQWDVGEAIRICAVETPITDGTFTRPDATTFTQTPDADHCWSLTPDQEGTWGLEYDITGPITRDIQWDAGAGGDKGWQWYLEAFAMFSLVLLGAMMGWLIVAGFSGAALVAHMIPNFDLGIEFALVMALFGVFLEIASNAVTRAKRNA